MNPNSAADDFTKTSHDIFTERKPRTKNQTASNNIIEYYMVIESNA
jgi:hypothetical protein